MYFKIKKALHKITIFKPQQNQSFKHIFHKLLLVFNLMNFYKI